MKKILIISMLLFMMSSCFFYAKADTFSDALSEVGGENLYSSLSDSVKESLSNLGIDSINPNNLKDVSFKSVLTEIFTIASKEAKNPLKSLAVTISIMLIYILFDSFKDNVKSPGMSFVLSVVTALSITTALVIPITFVIESASEAISNASNFMLLYIPVMSVILVTSGKAVSGGSYYGFVVLAGEGVNLLSTKVIVPLLNVFLGIGVSSAIAPDINLKGLTNLISKIIKWMLAFAMTLFSGLLTFKTIITTAIDSVSTRAVRFTLSSFIPIVGSALSEAYKTVQSSMSLLKSGLGVFVIISVAVVFLPSVMQCLIWVITINFSKVIGEIFGINFVCDLLSNVSSVISTLLAIILCIMAIYIISTAVILLIGGS
ncbi:MAG: hypothetical protein ACI4QE_04095 [Acutalibacteraceae bacterium]